MDEQIEKEELSSLINNIIQLVNTYNNITLLSNINANGLKELNQLIHMLEINDYQLYQCKECYNKITKQDN